MSYISGALISSGVGITSFLEYDEQTSDFTAGFLPILSYTVPAGKTLDLANVGVSDIMGGAWQLKKDADVILKGRTSPGNPDSDKSLSFPLPILEGETLSLEFCSRSGAPSNVTAFGYIAGGLRG